MNFPTAKVTPCADASQLVRALTDQRLPEADLSALGDRWWGVLWANDSTEWIACSDGHLRFGRGTYGDWTCRPARLGELTEARLFSPSADLHLWPDTGSWIGRWCTAVESTNPAVTSLPHSLLLLGTVATAPNADEFALMRGLDGRRHAAPVGGTATAGQRYALNAVEHLVLDGDTGMLSHGLLALTNLAPYTSGA